MHFNMNERINKLAKEAGLTYGAKQYYFSTTSFGVLEGDLEKFAELIVRECIEHKPKKMWQLNQGVWTRKSFKQRMMDYLGIK